MFILIKKKICKNKLEYAEFYKEMKKSKTFESSKI